MAVEYVYALHDFEPQNDDEIAFVAGERIEVLERDDAYGDGWWTGRNLSGHEGIFPKDYTTPAGPLLPDIRTPTGQSNFNTGGYGGTLHPLTEENESDSAVGPSDHIAGTRSGQPGGVSGPNGKKGGHVMAATMTDIQQAIDQLGVNRSNSAMTDDGRSLSFVSTRDDRTSIDDHDRGYNDDRGSIRDSMYDDGAGGRERMTMNEEWHRDARRRLFERVDQMDEAARRAQDEQEREEREYHRPPVDVEFSDESEDEDHRHHHHHAHVQQEVPNDLLNRIQPHHDDSIPSTIPSTFKDYSTTSLNGDDDRGDADVSNATAGQARRLADSPAKADSPTLAIDHAADPSPAISTAPFEHEDSRATPVQEPTRNILDATPEHKIAPTSNGSPVISSDDAGGDVFLPAIAPTSPFSPTPFAPSVQGTASVPGSATQAAYPISSSMIYPAPQGQPQPETETQTQQIDSPGPPMPAASSSYVSFLPSPTTTTFNTAPSGNNLPSQAMGAPPQNSSSDSRIVPPRKESITEHTEELSAPSVVSNIAGNASHTSHGNGGGNAPIISSVTSASLAPPATPSLASPTSVTTGGKKKSPPVEWNVEQVVEWVRSKGFDEAVCGKFAEHEITGDVLLEFDVNMLKEIDIIAFGKRMKIANAINELRRPPSFGSSDAISLNPHSISQLSIAGGQSPFSSAPQSTTAQNFASSNSMPHLGAGANHAHSMSHSTQGGYNASISSAMSSIQSPNIFGILHNQQQQGQTVNGGYSPNPYVMVSPDNSFRTGDVIGAAGHNSLGMAEQQKMSTGNHTHSRVDSDPGAAAVGEAARLLMAMNGYGDRAATIGHSASKGKGRPLSLAFSPSDSTLGQRGVVPVVPEEDGRAVLSDSDRKKRRDIVSVDSAVVYDPPDTPGSRSDTASRSSARPRSSLDTKTDRLSFFSRSRKPAPSDQSGSELGSPNITTAERQKTYSKLYLAGPTRPPRVGKSKEEREKDKKEKELREKAKREAKDKGKDKDKDTQKEMDTAAQTGILRKRTLSGDSHTRADLPSQPGTSGAAPGAITLRPGENVLQQLKEIVGDPDHSGFMLKKGERYNTWKNRFFFLKGPHIYYLRSKQETRIKGYINIRGYKVIADEATHPGRYGFRIVHDAQKPHFFSSEDHGTIREWMKALMKATIDRDFARPVISSCNIPTIPLTVAQAMNPTPRPPSPTAIAAAQRASRQEPGGLSSRDAKVLMGIADGSAILGAGPQGSAPQRPSREMRRPSVVNRANQAGPKAGGSNAALIQWINSQLPDQTPFATDLSTSLSSGLILFRLAESIKYGREAATARIHSPSPSESVVPDSLFDGGEERIDGLMKLFDFLLDNDVRLSGISMADVREGRSEKVSALVRSMKQWYDRRDAIVKAVGVGGPAGVMTWMQA